MHIVIILGKQSQMHIKSLCISHTILYINNVHLIMLLYFIIRCIEWILALTILVTRVDYGHLASKVGVNLLPHFAIYISFPQICAQSKK